MWIRKGNKDKQKNVDSPVPTEVVSNEEFIPRPQTEKQKQIEDLSMEWGARNAKKLGMSRRAYMASSMGIATCFLAANSVHRARAWDVDEEEQFEPEAVERKLTGGKKGKYFIMDVQAHFSNGYALGFRESETAMNMGFRLSNDAQAYGFRNFVKEMLLDSDTAMLVISGVPGKEINRREDGRILEGAERTPHGAILPSWLMAQSRDQINELAGSRRVLSQGNLAPNHYWNKVADRMDRAACIEQMERELNQYKIDSWKWYCHTDPGGAGRGFQLDDDNAQWFIEESRKRGMKTFSVHKGYSYQSKKLGHLANPKDVEKAALRNPDIDFIIYHSALKHGASDGENWKQMNEYNPETGDFLWHKVLMDIKRRNPGMNNVYCEIGSFFNTLVVQDPVMAMHGMGLNIKEYGADHVVWGTDCLWWGSPQWSIEAFMRFQISDELCEKHGYKKITDEDKAKIFGLNAAKIYGVDPEEQRNRLPGDTLSRIKEAYLHHGGMRDNHAHGWVRQA
ncbi:MAG: amidohydrolase family protein [Amphiplicatus sp.]